MQIPEAIDVILRDGRTLRLRVADPAHVPLAAIEALDELHETLVFEVALALVPLYGPLVATEALWGGYTVDGSRDAGALRDDRGERIKAMARRVQDGLRASQAVWQDLGVSR